MERFSVALEVRESVMKALEDARGAKVVNKSQEAAVTVTVPKDMFDVLTGFDITMFEELFIVSQVAFILGDEVSVEISRATGEKCPRCWNYRELGGNPRHLHVCQRCGDVLDTIGFTDE